jgi:HTH-type transcriptional regulator, sugar sensing transcriptional regulator
MALDPAILKSIVTTSVAVSSAWAAASGTRRVVSCEIWAPSGALFTMTTWTYDDKVSFISSRRENFGVIIQSEEFSDLMTTLFAVLWEVSRPSEAETRA